MPRLRVLWLAAWAWGAWVCWRAVALPRLNAVGPASAGAGPSWKVGASRVDITPEGSLWLSGYAARTKPSEGVAQRLYARAMAFEAAGGPRAVLVSVDLIGLPARVSDRIAAEAKARYGLEPSQLVLVASHTHSGPVIRNNLVTMYDLSEAESQKIRAYTDQMVSRVVEAVGEALEKLAPASLDFGEGRAAFAINRRARQGQQVVLGVNTGGPVDHSVPVLVARKPDGQLVAVAFGYACHCTTLGGDFYQICGDYAGYAQEELERLYPDAVALFVTGCGGDANPHPRGTLELAQQHGRTLAHEVSAVVSKGQLRQVRPPLVTLSEQFPLRLSRVPSREELQRRLKEGNVHEQRYSRYLLQMLDEEGRIPEAVSYRAQVWQFDADLTLVGLAGEVVVEYALHLKKQWATPTQAVWVAGYVNDVFAYIPTAKMLEEGGYEPIGSIIFYGLPAPFAPEVESVILERVGRMIEQARQQASR